MIATGETVSHYRILEELGHGGMGVVYKAEDTRLGRIVALKVLPPERVADPNRKRRFKQEARAASALNHPNIITIYDIDEVEGVHFIAMEYVDGKTLDRLIAHHGLPVDKTLKYAVEMAAALAAVGASLDERRPWFAGRRPALQSRWAPWAIAAAAVVAVAAVLFALNVGGLREREPPKAAAPPEIKSIAVLPLENLSHDPEQEYFADGTTDALIAELGQIRSLRVISRTSVMRYKGTEKPLPQIARELNVDALVEGSVLRAGDRVRITAQLIGAVPERHLWARNYERDLRDVLTLQGEVARSIANEIKANVTPDVQARLSTARPVNPEAHRLYLLGRFYWNKRTEEGFRKAIYDFQRAIAIDPNYAPAYAGLADSYTLLANWGFVPPRETIPKAEAAARKALEIDASQAEAITSLAIAYKDYDWDWAASEREFKRAIELNPNYATAHQWYAEYLSDMKSHDEGIAEAQRAQQLDPLSPTIRIAVAVWGGYLYARQYDEAIRRLQDTVALFPEFAPAYLYLGNAYEEKSMYQEAIAAYQKAWSIRGTSAAEIAALGQASAEAGMRGYHQWEIRRLGEESRHRYVRAIDFVWPLAGLGEKDQAFSYLEKAFQEPDYALNMLQVEPGFDPLRSDPRFQDLVRRMNFPP
jgi:TolB-like protein/Tfp pilus assembly protein PilF